MKSTEYESTLDLVLKIKSVHYKLIAHELPLIDQLTTLMIRSAKPDQVELFVIRNLFEKLLNLLPAHLNREAHVVYPVLLRQEENRVSLGRAVEEVADMKDEHDLILDLFGQLRQITNHYRFERGAHDNIRLAYEKLAAIDRAATDLIRLETDHAFAAFSA
ncbi:MAG: hemerythrin domain-containing protein [Eubacteriales bacterium]|nr:hemerythrin domain-containing protein [Eubacteriales bacterium]